jgi:hypothetical protein
MKQSPESNQLKEQIENTEVTIDNNKSQIYRDKTAEELSDLELEVESYMNNNTENREANLIKGKIVDVDLDKEGGKMVFTVEFKYNRGKFTINDLVDETDSKSGKIKLLENRVGERIEDTSKFLNQSLYIVRHKTGQLYGFIPKRRHKLTYAILGDYCVSDTDNIFPINALFAMWLGLVGLLACPGIIIILVSNPPHIIYIIFLIMAAIDGLGICSIAGALIGTPLTEEIDNNSVYEISETE